VDCLFPECFSDDTGQNTNLRLGGHDGATAHYTLNFGIQGRTIVNALSYTYMKYSIFFYSDSARRKKKRP